MVGIIGGGEVLEIVDDGDVKGTARAASDVLAEAEIVLGDLKEVAAGTRVGVGLQLLVPLHVLDLHVVVRHRTGLVWCRTTQGKLVRAEFDSGHKREGKTEWWRWRRLSGPFTQ